MFVRVFLYQKYVFICVVYLCLGVYFCTAFYGECGTIYVPAKVCGELHGSVIRIFP